MEFNKWSELEHATTEAEEKIYNVCFLKITNSWSSKQPIKGKKERSYLKNMVNETIDHTSSNNSLPIPKILSLPKNTEAIPKIDKKEIMKNQISRFK